MQAEAVLDRLTGLVWSRDANIAEYPMTWSEALAFVATLNQDRFMGFADWRLPNRRELLSLMSRQTRKPSLPVDHPFIHVFQNWYWTSTSAAPSPAHAWYVHLEGARLFYGGKDQSYMVWPVRGNSAMLPATGQTRCFDAAGREIDCQDSGQDGAYRAGLAWPAPRFMPEAEGVLDRLTGLVWRRCARLTGAPVDWNGAFAAVAALNRSSRSGWRLPNVHELESLVDCNRGCVADAQGPNWPGREALAWAPALPQGHPFEEVEAGYWSSTSSLFEPDWALYLDKGAVGVGQKYGRHFYAWAVRSADAVFPLTPVHSRW